MLESKPQKQKAMKAKKIIKISALVLLTMSFVRMDNNPHNFQTVAETDMKKHVKLNGKKFFTKGDPVALFKTALHFKVISNGTAMVGKGMPERNFATTWAVLNGIEDHHMQEITDEYYAMLKRKIEALGVKVVEYETIAKTEAFGKLSDKDSRREWSSKSVGATQIYTAFNGPLTPPVEGNISNWSKLGKLSKEVRAHAMFVDLVIDFAVFDINFHRSRGLKYSSTSASSKIIPEISIKPYYGGEVPPMGCSPAYSSLSVIPSYGNQGVISVNKNILFPGAFAENIDSYSGQMPKSMKRWISIGSELDLTTGTFVVHADPKLFKEKVMHALDQYTDLMLAKWKEVKK
jgi:hypothetical protein